MHDVRPGSTEADPGDEDREHDAQALPGELEREQRSGDPAAAPTAEAQGRPQIAHAAAVQDDRRDDEVGSTTSSEVASAACCGTSTTSVAQDDQDAAADAEQPGSRAREQPERDK